MASVRSWPVSRDPNLISHRSRGVDHPRDGHRRSKIKNQIALPLLLLLLPVASGFHPPTSHAPIARRVAESPHPFASTTETTHPTAITARPRPEGRAGAPTGGDQRAHPHAARRQDGTPHRHTARLPRRDLLRAAPWSAAVFLGGGTTARASAYTVDRVDPDEKETYATAQGGGGPLRVLWVGPGDLKGVFRGLFPAGNEVVAVDLVRPRAADLGAATAYAAEHGYRLRFERGDATDLKFADGAFDVVVSSQFLCQDFNPEVVVSEIRRVLRPGGRFGFYEDVEDIDKVIVGKVFGERSVIQVQHYPQMSNIMAGVVRKV